MKKKRKVVNGEKKGRPTPKQWKYANSISYYKALMRTKSCDGIYTLYETWKKI